MRKVIIIIIAIVMMIGIGYFILNQNHTSNTNEIENTVVDENRKEESNDSLEEEAVETMRIRVGDGSHKITFELNESEAALVVLIGVVGYGYYQKATYKTQNPLVTMEVENFSSNEKIFYPVKGLDVNNTPRANGGKAGILAYYEPWGDVVMFYDSFSSASGLYELGNATEGIEQIENLSGKITIEKLEN